MKIRMKSTLRVAAVSALFCASLAQAEISQIGVAAGVAVPMGDNYGTLGKTADLEADVWQMLPDLGTQALLRYSVDYRSYSPKNTNNSAVRNLGFFAGAQFVPASPGLLGMNPYFAAQLGAVYETLSMIEPAATQNTATVFAMRAVPGFEIPFGSAPIAIAFETPIEVIFTKSTQTVWNGLVGLRVKL